MSRLLALFPPGLVITDGAWGTQFQARGLAPGEPADLWNLTRPADVEAVARAYVEAGSRVILTNTFRANPIALEAVGAEDRTIEINRRGVELSRAAAGDGVRVFASMGPTGKLIAADEIDPEVVRVAFRRQAEAFAAAGADAVVCETFSDIAEARLAVEAVAQVGLPVVASFAFDAGKGKDRTMTGATPEKVAQALTEAGADAVGANCGAGPDAFLAVCRRLNAATDRPIWIKPNAGLPEMEGGRAVYRMTPAQFAAFRPGLVEAGAAFLGGCCGTSPEFIRALAAS